MSWHSDETTHDSESGLDGTAPGSGVWPDDVTLESDVAAALADAVLHARVAESGRRAFAAHRAMLAAADDLDLDLVLLRLVHDSNVDLAPAGVRDRTGGSSRTLVFEGEDLSVEVEVHPTGSIEGQLFPPQQGRVVLRQPDAVVATVSTDEVGCFRFDVHPAGPLRLECSSGSGTCLTEWLPW
jgi:hypothetical protein